MQFLIKSESINLLINLIIIHMLKNIMKKKKNGKEVVAFHIVQKF